MSNSPEFSSPQSPQTDQHRPASPLVDRNKRGISRRDFLRLAAGLVAAEALKYARPQHVDATDTAAGATVSPADLQLQHASIRVGGDGSKPGLGIVGHFPLHNNISIGVTGELTDTTTTTETIDTPKIENPITTRDFTVEQNDDIKDIKLEAEYRANAGKALETTAQLMQIMSPAARKLIEETFRVNADHIVIEYDMECSDVFEEAAKTNSLPWPHTDTVIKKIEGENVKLYPDLRVNVKVEEIVGPNTPTAALDLQRTIMVMNRDTAVRNALWEAMRSNIPEQSEVIKRLTSYQQSEVLEGIKFLKEHTNGGAVTEDQLIEYWRKRRLSPNQVRYKMKRDAEVIAIQIRELNEVKKNFSARGIDIKDDLYILWEASIASRTNLMNPEQILQDVYTEVSHGNGYPAAR